MIKSNNADKYYLNNLTSFVKKAKYILYVSVH